MAYEWFIARRYLGSKRQFRFINIIMIVSVIGIAVGVAALVIVLSVFNGFNSVVTQILVGFDPHIRVEAAKGRTINYSDSLVQAIMKDRRIAAASPFVAGKAMLTSPQLNRVVVIRGVVDSTIGDVAGVKKSTVLGQFAFKDTPAHRGIVIGLTLADRLARTVGSEITIVSPAGVDAMLLQSGQPLMKKCTVVGIYDSNNKDYDAHYAYVSLETARELFDYGDAVTGIEMRLHSIDHAEAVKRSLTGMLPAAFSVMTWYDLHKDLYSVMQIERWGAYIILCLIVAVATFNVLGSLMMGVIEKKRDIGVLKAMGSTRSGIVKVFMVEGLLVGAIGTLAGTAVGLLLCYLQAEYHLFPLDPNVYIIPAIPIEVRVSDFVAVPAASMALSAVASFYPALRAAKLRPIEAIRWE
jgi:lipoprotein-releasing system permease protein